MLLVLLVLNDGMLCKEWTEGADGDLYAEGGGEVNDEEMALSNCDGEMMAAVDLFRESLPELYRSSNGRP